MKPPASQYYWQLRPVEGVVPRKVSLKSQITIANPKSEEIKQDLYTPGDLGGFWTCHGVVSSWT